jgi:hypothetical protein
MGLIGLGIFELVVGYAFGRHGIHSRRDALSEYWINIRFHFVIGLPLAAGRQTVGLDDA